MSLAIALLLLMLVASAVALVLALNTMVALFRFRVPYVATPPWAIDWLCDNLPLLPEEGMSRSDRGGGSPPPLQGGVPSTEAERLALGGVVCDLGCGDARVLIALKKKFPAIKATGYEAAWFPYLLARWRTRRTGVTIRHQNFYQANLQDPDVVFCFLIHSVMPKVEQLLRSQLKPGATVFSYGFVFPTWRPAERIVNPKNPSGSKINIYRQLQY